MDEMERKFNLIREHYSRQDIELITKKGSRVFNTSHGIFGVSDLAEMFSFFQEVGALGERIIDLGSGDGRIALLASLFGPTTGIEVDKDLHNIAVKTREELIEHIPELERCRLVNGDYTEADLSGYTLFFTYADHGWTEDFENRLKASGGMLYSYQNIFTPKTIKKGKTIWVGQTPIVSYPL